MHACSSHYSPSRCERNFQISAGHFDFCSVHIVYSDADWGIVLILVVLLLVYVVFLRKNLIYWCTKKQPTVSKSSTKAECRVVAYTAAKIIWLRQLLVDLGYFLRRPVILYCDNFSTIYLIANPVHHDWSKHIVVGYHFVCKMIVKGGLMVRHVPNQSLVTWYCTKGLLSVTSRINAYCCGQQ